MTTPIHLRAEYWAFPLTKLGDQFKNLRILPADDKWTVPYLRYSYRSIYHTERLEKDIYCGDELPLEEGNWQLICTSKECTRAQAIEIVEREGDLFFDYELFRGHLQNYTEHPMQSFLSLLRSKDLDINNNYVILKKQ